MNRSGASAAERIGALPPLATAAVGSMPPPDWLVDREKLLGIGVPRVRVPQIWRIDEERRSSAQRDATLAAIAEQERVGLDVLTDGEMRRESYSNYFANSLGGVDPERMGTVRSSATTSIPAPLFSGPARRLGPVQRADVEFARAYTDRVLKATLPGAFTMSEQADFSYYESREELAMDLAAAVNEEVKDLFAAGADIVQLDEPWMERWPERSKVYGTKVLDRALRGVDGVVGIHLCFGYGRVVSPDKRTAYRFLEELEETAVSQVSIEAAQPGLDLEQLRLLPSKTIVLGVLDLEDERVETADEVVRRIEAALEYVEPDRLMVAPDCGLKYLPSEVALGKLAAMVEGARRVRERL